MVFFLSQMDLSTVLPSWSGDMLLGLASESINLVKVEAHARRSGVQFRPSAFGAVLTLVLRIIRLFICFTWLEKVFIYQKLIYH